MTVTQLAFAVPGDLAIRTGGYIYDRRVMDELRALGIAVDLVSLPASYPFPDAREVADTVAALNARPGNVPVVVDGLAWGGVPHEDARRVRGPLIALCHHPLGLEAGLAPGQAAYFIENETRNLALAAHVIVTSSMTARTLVQDFAVPAHRISIAEPGLDPVPRARGSGTGFVEILSVGALVPRKGHDLLIGALTGLGDLSWRLHVAGSHARAPDWMVHLRHILAASALQDRVVLAGELDSPALGQLYASADLFVSASHYEGYGMVLAEAMSHGLAIVTTTGGAAAETAPDACALKVPAGDGAALEQALRLAIADSDLRQRLGDAAWRAAQSLPRWSDTAAVFATAIGRSGGGVKA